MKTGSCTSLANGYSGVTERWRRKAEPHTTVNAKPSACQSLHGLLQPCQCHGVHFALHQLPDHVDGAGVMPALLWIGVEPDQPVEMLHETLHPDITGLLVPVLDAATGMADLVGCHAGIADKDHLPVAAIGVQQIVGRGALAVSPLVVFPHRLINEVVEIVIFQVLELGAAGAAQGLAFFD